MTSKISVESLLIDILKAAGKAHHDAFIDVNGDDPEWPTWYAKHIIDKVVKLYDDTTVERLAMILQNSDKEFRAMDATNITWHAYYAEQIIEHLSVR